MVIMAFSGVGKTTVAKKYSNVIDLESSFYEWKYEGEVDIEAMKGDSHREKNLAWPNNYISAIKKYYNLGKIVLIGMNALVRDRLEEEQIPYVVVFPSIECKKRYIQTYRERGNSIEFIKRREVMFEEWIQEFTKLPQEKWILDNNQTLEDMLKLKNIL